MDVGVEEGVKVGRGVGVSVGGGVGVMVLVGIGVFVGTIAAAMGVLGGTGVSDATVVGVETLVGVGEFVGTTATAGAAGSGVGGQDGSHPRRQRTEGSGAGGGGGANACVVNCQYQSDIAPPAREIAVVPPIKTRDDAKISFNIVRLLCPVVIQGGGLRIPFAAISLMNCLSRSIIATPTKSISNEQTKKKAPLVCQTATVHITAAPPIFHICPGGLNMNLRIESTESCIIDSMVDIQPLLPLGYVCGCGCGGCG